MRTLAALATALPLLLAACGGSSDPGALADSGQKALGSGDYSAALADFEKAVDAMGGDTSHQDYVRARLGAVEALTQIDASRAKSEFLELADAHSDRVNDRDFNRIGGRLGSAGNVNEGTELVQAGLKRYPESEHLKKLVQRLGDMAQQSGDSEALEALKGLGYVGD